MRDQLNNLHIFFFKQKTAYEMEMRTGVQTCALPISRRAIIPDVSEIITLEKASKMLSDFDVAIFFFEGGGKSLKEDRKSVV